MKHSRIIMRDDLIKFVSTALDTLDNDELALVANQIVTEHRVDYDEDDAFTITELNVDIEEDSCISDYDSDYNSDIEELNYGGC